MQSFLNVIILQTYTFFHNAHATIAWPRQTLLQETLELERTTQQQRFKTLAIFDVRRRANSVTSWTERIQHWCVLCYLGLEKLKKESNFGNLDGESKITEKKFPVCTRTPEGTAIKLNILRAFTKPRKELLLASICLSVSQPVHVKRPVSQWTDFRDILY